MSEVSLIEEDERDSKRALAWLDARLQFEAEAPIHRKDLSVQEISRLDRTTHAAKMSLAGMDLSTSMYPISRRTSTSPPPGSSAVASAAASADVARPAIRSVFDLASGMQYKEKPRGDTLRKGVKSALEGCEPETIQLLNEVCSEVQNPISIVSTENRPRLPEPRNKNYLTVVLALHQSIEDVLTECTDYLSEQNGRDLKEMEKLREEKIKVLEEHIRSMNSHQTWNALTKLARYFTFTSTGVLGMTLITSGVNGPAGYFLLASGGLGLFNTAAKDLSLFPAIIAYFTKSQEVQQKVAQDIDLFLTLCAMGLGFMGGIEAYGAGAFNIAKDASRDTVLLKAKDMIAWFTAAFTTVSFSGRSWSERKLNLVQANVEDLESKLFLLRDQLKSEHTHVQQMVKMAQVMTEETTRLLSSAEVNLGF